MKPAGKAAKDAVNEAGKKIPEPGQAESTTKVCTNHAHKQTLWCSGWTHKWFSRELEAILYPALWMPKDRA